MLGNLIPEFLSVPEGNGTPVIIYTKLRYSNHNRKTIIIKVVLIENISFYFLFPNADAKNMEVKFAYAMGYWLLEIGVTGKAIEFFDTDDYRTIEQEIRWLEERSFDCTFDCILTAKCIGKMS